MTPNEAPYTGHLIDTLTEMVERAEDNAAEACEGCGSTSDCESWCPESRGAERAGTEFFDETRGI